MRAPSQYVCSLDNQRTEAPSGRVLRTWRLATSISVTSFEPTLKTYTVSRLSAVPAAAADRTGAVLVSEALPPLPLELPAEGDVVGLDDPQAEASSPNAALLAALRSARRSRLEDRNQSVPPTNTPFASSREAQSSGAQCEGGLAAHRGLIIAFDIVSLLQGRTIACLADRDRSRQRRHRQTSRRALAGSVYLATICAPQHKHPIRRIHTGVGWPQEHVLRSRQKFCATYTCEVRDTKPKLTIRIYKPPGLRWIADRNTVPDSDQTADLDPWDLMPMHPRSDRRRRAGQDLSRLGEGTKLSGTAGRSMAHGSDAAPTVVRSRPEALEAA